MKNSSSPLARLKHHVTGAIERGEAKPIAGIPSKASHTPLPWAPEKPSAWDVTPHPIIDETGFRVAWVNQYASSHGDKKAEANAALIARAVNNHASLLAALKDLVRCNEEWNASVEKVIGRVPGWTDGYLDAARKAITQATS